MFKNKPKADLEKMEKIEAHEFKEPSRPSLNSPVAIKEAFKVIEDAIQTGQIDPGYHPGEGNLIWVPKDLLPDNGRVVFNSFMEFIILNKAPIKSAYEIEKENRKAKQEELSKLKDLHKVTLESIEQLSRELGLEENKK